MSLKNLPVFNEIIDSGMISIYKQARWTRTTVGEDMLGTMIDARRILCTLPVDDVPKGHVDFDRIFGHAALPYPKTWVEWQPSQAVSDFAKGDELAALCLSARMIKQESKLDRNRWDDLKETYPDLDMDTSWQLFFFMKTCRAKMIAMMPATLHVILDSSGQLIDIDAFLDLDSDEWEKLFPDVERNLAAASVSLQIGWGAIKTIGWINCRNVTTDRHEAHFNVTERGPRRANGKRGKAKRVRKFVDYHTIRLPGHSEQGGSGGDGTGDAQRLHTVRGHFKTFTKDAPLLGRHVGTYWWGYQLRGNASQGVAVTDYEVSA